MIPSDPIVAWLLTVPNGMAIIVGFMVLMKLFSMDNRLTVLETSLNMLFRRAGLHRNNGELSDE